MASPDIKVTWSGSCSRLWNNAIFGVVGNNTLTSLTFRQKDLSADVGTFLWVESCNSITSISFPNLTSRTNNGLFVFNCSSVTSISMPLCTTCVPTNSTTVPSFYVTGNPNLTTINVPVLIPDLTPLGFATDYNFTNNALNQTTVDMILARLLANPNVTFGFIGLDGGTNSPPSAQGTADKLALAARGCIVNTN